MSAAIDFYFDFSSPYGYLMAEMIEPLAARFGREVKWRPFLLGAVFRQTGGQPLPTVPLKGPYSKHDLERSARYFGLPYRFPDEFPISAHQASRAFYWLETRQPDLLPAFSRAIFRAYFVEGQDISRAESVAACGAGLGLDRDELMQAMGDEAVKSRLRAECDAALARGVFGSPYVVIDDEPFWGVDRLPQMERWLERGGF